MTTVKLMMDRPTHESLEHHDHPNYLPTPVTPLDDYRETKTEGGLYGTFAVQTDSRNTTDKQFSCHECNQTFSRPHNLKSHLTTHSSERPFQCDVCKHLFRRHHDLKRHQKLHTGERPHVCKACFRSFARLDALNRHRRAEGGTACSAVHQQRPSESSDDNNSSRSATPSSPPRGPQPSQHTTNVNNNIFPNVSDPPSLRAPSPPSLLPSPSALSSLPVSESADLMPIYNHPSPPSPTPHPPALPFQSSSWFGNTAASPNESRVLPPLQSTDPIWTRLYQENISLKATLSSLRLSEADKLKSRLHDLEVENKVLRSLISENATDSPLKKPRNH
ncbi:C2H2-type zinc finger transcription factor [Phycomyces blakesleeanus NRRL 1555(-)]|uniref:C2H2-type zinc finger transcription factor n=1 Tax=Phycomyces blakesleeanus (strain ATCC 8743b / DSM 1359 / FGSC 10004 / NBRC 33097 / NRRL 1555) TaxID=763407 RepID=A0A163AVG5_PHYB8|nr:C2H2-type zinc finger transcription factor [Phycomyces blakesleeanus NRRL 1555(-)]OAD76091.1 C2H2-type zinc finger transcription factor [Phycomyces blakesleeanus NRRL 1555(-)]|eukprot:XP_018294131.1 C2H2-type zinc finger transcription factor [Phycomyces blakesleeanus NRRL 1555(-)]